MLLSANREVATPRFIFEFLRSPVGQHALLSNTSQTGVPAIARPTTSLRSIPVIVPPIEILKFFDSIVDPIFTRKDLATEGGRSLAAVRDTLLPKLISGELRIEDAQRFIREHA
jgi:type I restriction enzyme, S subunit